MAKPYSNVKAWCIPRAAVQQSFEEMAMDGRKGDEGIMLWLGSRQDGTVMITDLVALRGPRIQKSPARIDIDATLLNDVTDLAMMLEKSLVGQIHSHGPLHGVDLSWVDRTFG